MFIVGGAKSSDAAADANAGRRWLLSGSPHPRDDLVASRAPPKTIRPGVGCGASNISGWGVSSASMWVGSGRGAVAAATPASLAPAAVMPSSSIPSSAVCCVGSEVGISTNPPTPTGASPSSSSVSLPSRSMPYLITSSSGRDMVFCPLVTPAALSAPPRLAPPTQRISKCRAALQSSAQTSRRRSDDRQLCRTHG